MLRVEVLIRRWHLFKGQCLLEEMRYLQYHSAFDHQTLQDSELPWVALTYKVTRTFCHVVLQDELTNKNHYISITAVPMAAKLDKLVTFFEGLSSTLRGS